MIVHKDMNALPSFTRAVITIGTFDGVHRGHQQIIRSLCEEAANCEGESVLVTFHPHPRQVVSSTILGVRLINTLDERIELFREAGIDHLVIVPFTTAFAHQDAEEYIRDFLVANFHPHTIIIGYDHRFGKDRAGNYELLEEKAIQFGYQIKEIPRHQLHESAVSSTRIREALVDGKVAIANELLGYEFFFEGKVVHGDKLGRELGYPTANLQITDNEKMLPGDGIYAVYIDYKDHRYKGMMSIGFRPTVGGHRRVVEVNIFDFNQSIYGETIRVMVKAHLRAEEKFDSLEMLVKQIDQDKQNSLAIL